METSIIETVSIEIGNGLWASWASLSEIYEKVTETFNALKEKGYFDIQIIMDQSSSWDQEYNAPDSGYITLLYKRYLTEDEKAAIERKELEEKTAKKLADKKRREENKQRELAQLAKLKAKYEK